MRKKTIQLNNEAETIAIGKALAQVLVPGMKLYLYGDLGAGKTTLTRALLHAAGYVGKVKSPTYALAEPYTIALRGKTTGLMHFDLFRMETPEEFLDAGFMEYFGDDSVCIVEWPEKAAGLLPDPDIEGLFLIAGTGRRLTLTAVTEAGSDAIGKICLPDE